MYGETGDTLADNRKNDKSSTIKGVIDTWYTTNLNGENTKDNSGNTYGSYLSRTAVYCNDRATSSYSTSSMNYAAYYRLVSNKRPSFKCGNDQNGSPYTSGAPDIADRFTGSNESSVGNGKLGNKPVALMTADEVSYAGGLSGTNNSSAWYYQNSSGSSVTGSTYWWTMSPCHASSSGFASVFFVVGSDYPGVLDGTYVNGSYGVRPVVSLKSCVSVTGSGKTSDPYIPSIDSACALADN